MAPGFRSPLPLDGSRSYCISDSTGQSICGPRSYVESFIRDRLASGERPDDWVRELDPIHRRLVEEVMDDMWNEAVSRNRRHADAVRAAAVRIARREYDAWHDPDLTETDTAGKALVKNYWKDGVRRNVTDAELSSSSWQHDNPWSSAFISYVMREAGAGGDFRYSWAHASYIRAAIDNRRQDKSSMFRGYRLNEQSVAVGDLVAKRRDGSRANYDNVVRGMLTHGDLVTSVGESTVTAVGGNVVQNVDEKTLAIDSRGRLTEPDYFAVIKIVGYVPPR